MKKITCLLGIVLILQSCKSVESYNASITEKKSVQSLREDVDITYTKLQKLHPNLYQYTPKDSMDLAFENLKKDIIQPLTPQEFYQKLTPVVKKVGQGHVGVYRPYEKLPKDKRKALKGKRQQFYSLVYNYIDDSLYVKKVMNYDTLLVGSQVLKVDGESVDDIFNRFKKRMASDGYNTTFYHPFIAQHFSRLYSLDKGFRDSIQVTFKKKDTLYTHMFRYFPKDSSYYVREQIKDTSEIRKLTKAEKKALKEQAKQRRKYNKIYDFNPSTGNYARNFQLMGEDSTVAYMKIRSFSGGKFKPYYEAAFNKIKKENIQDLVIDLRDNNGGSLQEISVFYSYLVQEPFRFINEAQVKSRTHTLKSMISAGNPAAFNIIASIVSPIVVTRDLLKTHKEEGKLYYRIKQSKWEEPKENNFKGNIYVLINGSSFSASSILSTNLKATGRAFFVGEETGGAYNGTVAGKYKLVRLPNSQIRLRMGLMQIETPYKQEPDGYGVKPDIEITPTLETLENDKDEALEWVLNRIED